MNRYPVEEPSGRQDEPFVLVIEIDAWNIRERTHWGQAEEIRKKGEKPDHWHWVCTGTVFALKDRIEKDKRPMIVNRGYVATRQGLDALREQLHAEAMRRGLARADKVLILADGASWIWNLAEDRFKEAHQRLDLYHLHQHLWAVARDLYPEDEKKMKQWIGRKKKQLSTGRSAKVIEDNEPQGSGAIESTCRQYQSRFKTVGQFWSTTGDEAVLSIATFLRNERMHVLFPHVKLSPHYRN